MHSNTLCRDICSFNSLPCNNMGLNIIYCLLSWFCELIVLRRRFFTHGFLSSWFLSGGWALVMRSDLCIHMQSFGFALIQAIPMLIHVSLTDGTLWNWMLWWLAQTSSCQSHLGESSLDMPVRDYLDWVNKSRNSCLNCAGGGTKSARLLDFIKG